MWWLWLWLCAVHAVHAAQGGWGPEGGPGLLPPSAKKQPAAPRPPRSALAEQPEAGTPDAWARLALCHRALNDVEGALNVSGWVGGWRAGWRAVCWYDGGAWRPGAAAWRVLDAAQCCNSVPTLCRLVHCCCRQTPSPPSFRVLRLTQVYRAVVQQLGPDHPGHIEAVVALADLHRELGQQQEAERWAGASAAVLVVPVAVGRQGHARGVRPAPEHPCPAPAPAPPSCTTPPCCHRHLAWPPACLPARPPAWLQRAGRPGGAHPHPGHARRPRGGAGVCAAPRKHLLRLRQEREWGGGSRGGPGCVELAQGSGAG